MHFRFHRLKIACRSVYSAHGEVKSKASVYVTMNATNLRNDIMLLCAIETLFFYIKRQKFNNTSRYFRK